MLDGCTALANVWLSIQLEVGESKTFLPSRETDKDGVRTRVPIDLRRRGGGSLCRLDLTGIGGKHR